LWSLQVKEMLPLSPGVRTGGSFPRVFVGPAESGLARRVEANGICRLFLSSFLFFRKEGDGEWSRANRARIRHAPFPSKTPVVNLKRVASRGRCTQICGGAAATLETLGKASPIPPSKSAGAGPKVTYQPCLAFRVRVSFLGLQPCDGSVNDGGDGGRSNNSPSSPRR